MLENILFFLHAVRESRLKAVRKHYLENGMEAHVHKNTKRLPPKALSWEDSITFTKLMEKWKAHMIVLPTKAKLALKYLCVRANSSPSEKIFSCSGHIVSKKRTLLKPDKVNMLVFLSKNTFTNY